LNETKGTLTFIELVEKFDLKDRKNELVTMATGQPGEIAAAATGLLFKFNAIQSIKPLLHKNDSASLILLESMKGKSNSEVLDLVAGVVKDRSLSREIRTTAIQVLGSTWPGEEKLLALVKDAEFDTELEPPAGAVLFNVYRSKIQREAAEYLPAPAAKGTKLPPIKQLLASTGDAKRGQTIFEKHCTTCHKVKDTGVSFGPELSVIGEKLSREGLYRSILYPNEGVSFGYETTLVRLHDGTESMGIIASETPNEFTINFPGGSSVNYNRSVISNTERQQISLMPELASAMSEQDLIDLVEYLVSLKKGSR
jgi:putative heme-binding domain-containing protein